MTRKLHLNISVIVASMLVTTSSIIAADHPLSVPAEAAAVAAASTVEHVPTEEARAAAAPTEDERAYERAVRAAAMAAAEAAGYEGGGAGGVPAAAVAEVPPLLHVLAANPVTSACVMTLLDGERDGWDSSRNPCLSSLSKLKRLHPLIRDAVGNFQKNSSLYAFDIVYDSSIYQALSAIKKGIHITLKGYYGSTILNIVNHSTLAPYLVEEENRIIKLVGIEISSDPIDRLNIFLGELLVNPRIDPRTIQHLKLCWRNMGNPRETTAQLTTLMGKLRGFSNLRVLDLSNNYIGRDIGFLESITVLSERMTALSEGLALLPSLQTLSLEDNDINTGKMITLLERLSLLPSLRVLNLKGNPLLSSLPVRITAQMVKFSLLPGLEVLSLRGYHRIFSCGDADLNALLSGLSLLKGLRVLDLAENHMFYDVSSGTSTAQITTLMGALSSLPHLAVLDLENNIIGGYSSDVGYGRPGDEVTPARTLQHIRNIEALMTGLRTFPNLKRLGLARNYIGYDDSAEKIAALLTGLESLPGLEVVDLRENNLSFKSGTHVTTAERAGFRPLKYLREIGRLKGNYGPSADGSILFPGHIRIIP